MEINREMLALLDKIDSAMCSNMDEYAYTKSYELVDRLRDLLKLQAGHGCPDCHGEGIAPTGDLREGQTVYLLAADIDAGCVGQESAVIYPRSLEYIEATVAAGNPGAAHAHVKLRHDDSFGYYDRRAIMIEKLPAVPIPEDPQRSTEMEIEGVMKKLKGFTSCTEVFSDDDHGIVTMVTYSTVNDDGPVVHFIAERRSGERLENCGTLRSALNFLIMKEAYQLESL